LNLPFNNLKTFFVVDELSQAMKTKVKNSDDFIVLWNTEENNLMNDIYKYLEGELAQLREDKRVPQLSSAMLKPSMMLENIDEMVFKRINGGAFENISTNGSCLNLPNADYKPKDFVSITYQNNEGNYISQEAQIRWIENNPQNEVQRIGLRFLTQG
jgi:c-di-GMP-binding flagellar brake protein YcgR